MSRSSIDGGVGIGAGVSIGSIDDFVHALLERIGRYQIVLIIFLSFNSVIVGINHTITTFHIYVPEFHCKDNHNETCNYYVNGSECPSGYDFDKTDDTTVAVEFETVCNRAMLAPLINTLYFVGVTLGALICSSLCDIYGRSKLVVICLYGQLLMAICQYFSYNLYAFIGFRLMQGFFIQGLQTCSYTLIMEYCPSRYRTIAATYWESNWAVGLIFLGVASYFVRDWRMLTLALTLPQFLSFAYVWLIPESLVWLKARGLDHKLRPLMAKIIRYNRRDDLLLKFDDFCMDKADDYVDKSSNEGNEDLRQDAYNEKVSLSVVFSNRVLRKHLLAMINIWFSVTLSYYGILYYLPNLAGQRHLNFGIGAIIELIAYVLAYFILSRFGRRLPMALYQYANGFLLLTVVILRCLPDGSYGEIWITGISLMAKGLAVSCFCGMFIYCSELLPTVCRGLGLGLCGCAARCGSLFAPQLMALMYFVPEYIPLGIMAALLLITASITLLLPETVSTILPNTIRQADERWGKQ